MINRTNVCDQIVEEIKTSIIDGRLKAGDQLPNERELAKVYGVSRVPLREALRSLRQMGVIETKHGIGTFINDINVTLLLKDLNSSRYLEEKPIFEILQLRRVLEVESARLAAENATTDDFKTLEAAENQVIAELKKFLEGQNSSFYEADLKFHLAVASASHNSLFIQFINIIHGSLHIHQMLSLKETAPIDEVVKYHRKISEAIEAKDPDQAAEKMLEHINRVEELILMGMDKQKRL